MVAINICPWLKINSLERCGKNCVNKYCSTHRKQFRLGRKSPVPCRRCGMGTGSITILCRSCGSHRVVQKLIDIEKRARRQFVHTLIEIKARETPKDPTLLYFGAGWDFKPLSNPDYHKFTHLVFIDALPNTAQYRPGQVGYSLSKDRISFVNTLVREAKKEKLVLYSDINDVLTFIHIRGATLKYYINMSVEQALSSPIVRPKISAAKWVHVEGFYPSESGLKVTHLPNAYLTLGKLREAMP